MGSYMVDMVLCGIAYVIMVYFMVMLLRKRNSASEDDDDNEGGISINDLPEIDLPPGVSLPDGGDGGIRLSRKEEKEDIFA